MMQQALPRYTRIEIETDPDFGYKIYGVLQQEDRHYIDWEPFLWLARRRAKRMVKILEAHWHPQIVQAYVITEEI